MSTTLIAFFIGIYGTTFVEDGGFYIFGQAVSLYLLIVHPALLFGYSRAILKLSDHKSVPEVLIFSIIAIPFFPIVYTMIPIAYQFFSGEISVGATDIIFVIFEVAALGAGFYAFVRYAKRFVTDKLVPRDIYAIQHYLIGTLIYFYFVRLTIISSILASGAF